jgi:glycosyltransferase involved in cell wall biosynthesis
MRLLYVTLDRGIPVGGTKGASIHVSELLRAFEAEGHETALVVRAPTAGAPERPVFTASVPDRLRWVPGATLRRDLREVRAGRGLRRALRDAVAEFRPDAIYERYALFRTEACGEARRAAIPLLLEVNAPLAWEERRFRNLALTRKAERAELGAWRGADLVVVPSNPLGELVRERSGQERVLVVPNAVDIDRFDRPLQDDLRQQLGLGSRHVVGFAGSLKPWHDLETLVSAVADLPKRLQAVLLLVGEGPERDRLADRAAALGVDIVTTGAVPHAEVADYLGAMDVCVAGLPADPTLHYFSPLKVLEYMAAGRPTVVADAGDLATIAAAGAAIAYQPEDAADLTAQLLALATSAELRERLSGAGRAYARTRTWRAAARTIVQAADRLRCTSPTA